MTVDLALQDGEKTSVERGLTAGEALTLCAFSNAENIVAVRLNNEIVSLTQRITVNSSLEPVYLDSLDGTALYRRTLCFLLAIAVRKLFPDRRLVIGHSLGEGYYYYFDGIPDVTSADIEKMSEHMAGLVDADLPIKHEEISYGDAIRYFKARHQPYTALLLKYCHGPTIPVYQCGDHIDLAYGPLVSRTGFLRTFELRRYTPGFLLRFAKRADLASIAPFKENPVLFSIYQEYLSWGKILHMDCLGLLNQLIHSDQIDEFIQVAEALHDKKIASIADSICERSDSLNLVLIAGPSSSGKTTFAKKLAIQLRVLGRNPVTVSLDDYFLPRELTPIDDDGNPDFESLDAIDVKLLNANILQLLGGKEVEIPRFDFVSGKRKAHGEIIRLPARSVVILEGIHGLNDGLTPDIERHRKFKIYVSALTQLNLDDHNRIPTTDNRLIRRIVRDYKFRGNSALATLRMWPSVRRGEDRNIFPFQNTADAAFNSALDYELAVLKIYAEPLLRAVEPDAREYSEARRILAFLDNFTPIPPTRVPPQSILREFIGESEFQY
jgi:uridine kinase